MSDHARDNARAWLGELVMLAAQLDSDDGDVAEVARETAQEKPLSVQVRDGWRNPGPREGGPEEYEILLSTGGPALRIRGDLDGDEPDAWPKLQWQDWGTPWTDVDPLNSDQRAALVTFANCFYYGDG